MSRWSEDVGSVMIPPGGEIESDQIASMFLNVQYSPFYEGTPSSCAGLLARVCRVAVRIPCSVGARHALP